VNNHAHVLRPKSVEPRFLAHALNSVEYRAFIDGSTRDKLTQDDMRNIPIQCPSLSEQRAIAEFLDRKTAKIDELIAKKERLIELLEEKRAALIIHAVTRGLNPDAPLRDSGIEWLGQVPKHWEVRPLKNEFRFQKGRNAQLLTASYIKDHEGEYPVYSGQTENDGIMGLISSYEYDVPEVLFATTVGAKAMTPMTLKGKFSLSQNCLIMSPKKTETVTRFFYYELHPLFAFERGSIPAHMQPSLRISDLRSYAVACPPSPEQSEIASYLNEASTRVRTLRETIQRAIDKLTEYRTALITAAVTGKIDVRDEVKRAA
jgi:type I restriction enzyme, S subunit